MSRKAFTLIELLVVVAIIGILAAVGMVSYNGYTASAKIVASKEQHNSMKKFIEASYGQCALGDNYVLMNTCKLNNWSCNGLRVGNSNLGTVKRPCNLEQAVLVIQLIILCFILTIVVLKILMI